MDRKEQVEIKVADYLQGIEKEVMAVVKSYDGKVVTPADMRKILFKVDAILLSRKATKEFRVLVLKNIMDSFRESPLVNIDINKKPLTSLGSSQSAKPDVGLYKKSETEKKPEKSEGN